MRFPTFLPPQGTIGFLAPSFGCSFDPYKAAFDHSLQVWQQMGHKTLLGPNVYEASGVGISNTPEKCAAEVETMFASEADVLISCGGGELMCEVVPFIDFDKLAKQPPKWFMGYSDNTNLTFLLPTFCDTAAVYGPCASTFGQEPWHEALWDVYHLLRGEKNTFAGYDSWEKESLKSAEQPLAPYHCTEKRELKAYRNGVMVEHMTLQGRLLGGCLDCLQILCGTKYDRVKEFGEKYAEDGILWFVESCELSPLDLRRVLWSLREAGWFDHAVGLIVGRPMRYGEEMMGVDMVTAVLDTFKGWDLPILLDADLGHLPPQIPWVAGAYGEVRVDGQSFALNQTFRE